MENKNLKLIYFLLFFIMVCCTACNKQNTLGTPTYISLKRPILETTINQGEAVHSFSDIWVESEGLNLGAYEYPGVFPSFLENQKTVVCNPGVFFNGNGLERRLYPVIEAFDSSYNFALQDTVEIQAIFRYKENVDFIYIEDFEFTNNFSNSNRTEALDSNNQTGKAGSITLETGDDFVNSTTISPIEIVEGRRVFLEFSLKTQNFGGFGFRSAINPENQILLGSFSPFSEWTTIYYSLTNFINVVDEGEYHFFIDVERGDLEEESTTYIDNFKILQF